MSERDRLLEIMGRYAEGATTAEETRELEGALRADADLRREALRYLNLDAALSGAVGTLRAVKREERPAVSRLRRVWFGAVALAAAALLVLFLGLQKMWWHPRVAEPFVTLVAANDAIWADPNAELALRAGELPPGPLRLESGTAEFLFADGATMLLRGATAVRFLERKRVFVEHGRIFCRCPSPESRLSVETPATRIVDLGTEFAVEARADRSTLVAVLSGEVQVGKGQPQRLHKGQAAVVRGDGILAIQPLGQEDFSELLLASPSVNEAIRNGRNVLRDPGFEAGLSEETWSGTEPNLAVVPTGGRSGAAVRITSDGRAPWPQCRQKIATGDIAGRLVVGTVWAAPGDEALRPRQSAMLKIVFVNEKGRDFAFAMRRFLDPKSVPHRFEQAQVAVFAPPGTRQVQMQLMFQTSLRDSGSVLFDDASLIFADPSAAK